VTVNPESLLAERGPFIREAGLRPPRNYWLQSWDRLVRNRLGVVAAGVLVLAAALAITAPLWTIFVTHQTPDGLDLSAVFQGPSSRHWLGTDELGRDTFTRMIWGARASLTVGFVAVGLFVLIGGGLGIVAGYYGGLADELIMRVVDALLAIPIVYLLILFTGLLPLPVGPADRPWFVLRHDPLTLALVIAILGWGPFARLVRGDALTVRTREFMTATRSLGASDARLMLRHLLPNVLPVMVVTASLEIGFVILLEASLDYIGLGIQPPTASWGNMLLNAQSYFYHSGILVFAPGIAIVLTVMAANVLGNALRDALDPRLE